MLHPLKFDDRLKKHWCVPSAVSILTGAPVYHMHSRAAFHLGIPLKEVEGIHNGNALLLLREQGYRVQRIPLEERYEKAPTIQRFFAERTPYEFVMPIYFATPDHAMTCHMGFACDNFTRRPVPVSEFPKLRRKVEAAWIVIPEKK